MNVLGLYFLDCKMGIIILIDSCLGKCLEGTPEPGIALFSPPLWLIAHCLPASLQSPARPALQPARLLPQNTLGGPVVCGIPWGMQRHRQVGVMATRHIGLVCNAVRAQECVTPQVNPRDHPRGCQGGEEGPGKNDWLCLAREMVQSPTLWLCPAHLPPDGQRGLSPTGRSWGAWSWSSEFHCRVFCSLAKARIWAGSGLASDPCISGLWARCPPALFPTYSRHLP